MRIELLPVLAVALLLTACSGALLLTVPTVASLQCQAPIKAQRSIDPSGVTKSATTTFAAPIDNVPPAADTNPNAHCSSSRYGDYVPPECRGTPEFPPTHPLTSHPLSLMRDVEPGQCVLSWRYKLAEWFSASLDNVYWPVVLELDDIKAIKVAHHTTTKQIKKKPASTYYYIAVHLNDGAQIPLRAGSGYPDYEEAKRADQMLKDFQAQVKRISNSEGLAMHWEEAMWPQAVAWCVAVFVVSAVTSLLVLDDLSIFQSLAQLGSSTSRTATATASVGSSTGSSSSPIGISYPDARPLPSNAGVKED
eukprot:TRINITY_DN3805_c0_g1_i5.p2 TRINITY_DN3805_c0_g1~~TRINITY_DN3805_c0_g1_i5.p2  ORF type:complete len:307 (-),score=57.62 TRINITY_DN3805_c0_g1_i5:1379-2299(-)